MKFLPLMRSRLKDDNVIRLLEDCDAVVTYDFDRSFENMPDVYWAASTDYGVQMRFDENQILDVIFIYIKSKEEFQPFPIRDLEDIIPFSSAQDTENYCIKNNIPYSQGSGSAPDTINRVWVRMDTTVAIHYEFIEGELSMITCMHNTNTAEQGAAANP